MANIESVRLPDGSEFDIVDAITPRSEASNPNLLINPWFTVNQRETTSGTIVSGAFTVDHWAMSYGSGGTWSLGSSGLTITPSAGSHALVYQKMENPTDFNGKTVTISALLSDGTVYSYTFVRASGTRQYQTENHIQLEWSALEQIIVYTRDGYSNTFRAVKLELGSTSTLHLDAAPDYTTELLKCQRYYVRFSAINTNQLSAIGSGANATTARFVFYLPVPMRTTPTLSVTGTLKIQYGTNLINVNSYSLSEYSPFCFWVACVVSSGLSAGAMCNLVISSIGDYIALDAEI